MKAKLLKHFNLKKADVETIQMKTSSHCKFSLWLTRKHWGNSYFKIRHKIKASALLSSRAVQGNIHHSAECPFISYKTQLSHSHGTKSSILPFVWPTYVRKYTSMQESAGCTGCLWNSSNTLPFHDGRTCLQSPGYVHSFLHLKLTLPFVTKLVSYHGRLL